MRHADKPHWVYRCYDDAGRLLYVGCTHDPKKRRSQHVGTAWWRFKTRHVLMGPFPQDRALGIERELIQTLRPFFTATSEDRVESRRLWQLTKKSMDAWLAEHPDASVDEFLAADIQQLRTPPLHERQMHRYLSVLAGAAA